MNSSMTPVSSARVRLARAFCLAMTLPLSLLTQQAMAQSQQVRVAVDPLGDGLYRASVYYQSSDGSAATGLGLRLHYASTQISNVSVANVHTGDLLSTALQQDSANGDNNTLTDSLFNAAWISFSGSAWPASASAETLLFRLQFRPVNSSGSQPVTLTLTRSSGASGYTFAAQNFSAVLTPAPTPTPTPTPVPTPEPTPEPTPVPTPTPTPTPTPVSTPTPIPSPSPVASPTPSPTPSPTAVVTVAGLQDELSKITITVGAPVTEAVVEQLTTALGNTASLARQTLENLPEGTAGVDLALSALNTMGSALTLSGTAQLQGAQLQQSSVVSSLSSVASVLEAMGTRTETITETQRVAVQTFTQVTVSSSASLINSTSTPDQLVQLVAATSAVINAAASAGAQLSTELASQTEQLVTKAIQAGVTSFSAGIDPSDARQVQALLRSNPDALDFAIAASVAVTSRLKANSTQIETELSNRGVAAELSESLGTVLDAVSNPDGVTVGGVNATETLLAALTQFLTGGSAAALANVLGGLSLYTVSSNGVQIEVDPLTGSLIIMAPGERYVGSAVSIRLVSGNMPQGISYMRDGRALVVANGLAIEIAPTPADIVGFASAVRSAGFTFSLRSNGGVEIALGNGEFFSGAVAYDNLGAANGACGTISFLAPQGALTAADYAFRMQCGNGVTQRIVPFVHDNAFYSAMADTGAPATTDRNTGYVTLSGLGRFKPGFFVSPLSSAEAQLLAAPANARGVALQTRDVNGDGMNDLVLLSSRGAQPLYGVAP